jgi:cysteine-rich repeat protein
MCRSWVCVPGTPSCLDADSTQLCAADGFGYGPLTDCGTGESCDAGNCAVRCGDGIVGGTESCDDGNTLDGDGCSALCADESCGYASFDGTGLLRAGSFNLPDVPHTVEAWIRLDATADRPIVSIGRLSFTARATQRDVVVQHTAHNSWFITSRASPLVLGSWHHVAYTYNGAGYATAGSMTVFVDGTPYPMTFEGNAGRNPLPTSGGTDIGREVTESSPAYRYFDGDMRLLRVSDGRRYTGAFTPNRTYASDASTRAFWPLDDGMGTLADDVTGTNDATLSGGVTWGAASCDACGSTASFVDDWQESTANPRHVALGDLDGDARDEIAIGYLDGRVRMASRSTGSWAVSQTLFDGSSTGEVAGLRFGDADNDGDPDLLVAHYSGGPVRVFRNDGGVLSVAWTSAERENHGRGDWGDYDGDGDLDVAVAVGSGGRSRVYRNDGAFRFVSAWLAPVSGHAVHARWADLDGDRDVDLLVGMEVAISSAGARTVTAFRNDGGSLTSAWGAGSGSGYAIEPADYDGDGDLDLAVADFVGAVRLYRNDGAFTFSDGPVYTGCVPHSLAWRAESHGRPTLAVSCQAGPTRLLDVAGAALTERWASSRTSRFGHVATGDVNGDGVADLVNSAPDAARTNVYVGECGLVDYAGLVRALGATAYWPMEERSGTVITDVIGGRVATATGGTVAQDVTGLHASSGNASGFSSAGYFVAPADPTLVTPAFSVEAWIRVDNCDYSAPGSFYAMRHGEGYQGWGVWVSLGEVAFEIASTTGFGWNTVRFACVEGAVEHIVGTYESGTMRLYRNGVLVGTTGSTTPVLATGRVGLGARVESAPAPFTGALDDVAIYPRALTAAEVALHYAAR